jgi:5-methylcytosine-specific restriction endonuclease McrA
MNYKRHYEALCYGRQTMSRVKTESEYYEVHHILPRSLGGQDTADNLVLLTAREHYIAHLLLYSIHKQQGGDALRRMSFALVSMLSTANTTQSRFSSRSYGIMREAAMNASLGRKIQDTINYAKPKSEAHKEAIRQARLVAPKRSQETRKKLSIAAKSRTTFTANYVRSVCPHCLKEGQSTAMKRWHFTNCKQREEVTNA